MSVYFLLALVATAQANVPCADGDSSCEADEAGFGQLRAQGVKRHLSNPIPDVTPFEITPCNPLIQPCTHTCGSVQGYKCSQKGWVFCQNAVCDETPVQVNGKWVSKCHCWQPSNTNESILPVEQNSGANCVLQAGVGGETMCQQIGEGKLWSTFGPDGSYLPGKPLKAARCPKHTIWAWCWGAPCEKDSNYGQKDSNGNTIGITCNCPIMKTMNQLAQMLSLAGDEQCPPGENDPCLKGYQHNSMPAGTSPSEYMPDAANSTCYNYEACDPRNSD